KGAQGHGIDQTKGRCAGADGKCEGQDGGGGGDFALEQLAGAKDKIGAQGSEPWHESQFGAGFERRQTFGLHKLLLYPELWLRTTGTRTPRASKRAYNGAMFTRRQLLQTLPTAAALSTRLY